MADMNGSGWERWKKMVGEELRGEIAAFLCVCACVC